MKVEAENPLFTLRQVAKILNEDVETLFELACDMGPKEGCVTVHDEAFSLDDRQFIGTAFTNAGIEYLVARLAEHAALY